MVSVRVCETVVLVVVYGGGASWMGWRVMSGRGTWSAWVWTLVDMMPWSCAAEVSVQMVVVAIVEVTRLIRETGEMIYVLEVFEGRVRMVRMKWKLCERCS